VAQVEYKYVDFQFNHGVASKWVRVSLADIRSKVQQASNLNCFATIQRFSSKIRPEGSKVREEHLAPLYFDLDYAEDPAVAQKEAVKIVDFFRYDLDIDYSAMKIFFSGSKGFHLLVSNKVFGVEPSEHVTGVYKYIANYLRFKLANKTKDGSTPLVSIDNVYSIRRMLRIPNSRHSKTDLFKIELTYDELCNLSLTEIKEKAKTPREESVYSEDEIRKSTRLNKTAAEFYKIMFSEYTELQLISDTKRESTFSFNKEEMPVCVKDIYENGWKKDGDRNNATIQLACFFSEAGYSINETENLLVAWTRKHSTASSDYQLDIRVSSTKTVVHTVYSPKSEYNFGCKFIRSLHGDKKPGEKEYERVPCSGNLCKFKLDNYIDENDIVNLHLAKTGNSLYNNKIISTNVMVAGKKSTPYIVPAKIEFSCWATQGCKKHECPLKSIKSGTLYKELTNVSRELIQMCGVGDNNIRGILKDLSCIPLCSRYDIAVHESINVEELLVIPMVEIDEEEEKNRYVLRKIYSVGDVDIEENKYYKITGVVFPHPKTQEGTIMVKSAEPLQDVIESFEYNDNVKDSLRIFQPANPRNLESIARRLDSILDDLTYNVTRIVERSETLLGMLLVYHSVLKFRVPWDADPIRGWLETIVIGDTSTGKSAMAEKLMAYVKLGKRINAESTSRTGLTYKMEQNGSGSWYIVWGAWPLSDKELVWIDECSAIPKEEYGQMTLARSDGKLEVKRAVTAETTCRVRAILSGNVPLGKRLADFSQGVESLKQIFNNEDIRRFDFSIFMKSTDVELEKYNKILPTFESNFSGEDLKNNILFAWSRKVDDVIIEEEAADAILFYSTKLSKIYGNATDVPLVSPSDQRNKFARITVALAALLHSVDETGEKIVVIKPHVEIIYNYLKTVYNAPGCALNYYAKLAVKEETLTLDQYKKLMEYLRNSVSFLKREYDFISFIRLFANQQYLGINDVEAMLSIDRNDVKELLSTLQRAKMIVRTSSGFRKTARFNSFINKAFSIGIFDESEEDII
jgi:hypothetical protein